MLLFAAVFIGALLGRRFWLWIRRDGGMNSGAEWIAAGMAVLCVLLGLNVASGFALIVWDFDFPAWLGEWHWFSDWRWLTLWYWIEIAAGWVLTSLLLLSITGLLRPRQASGGKD